MRKRRKRKNSAMLAPEMIVLKVKIRFTSHSHSYADLYSKPWKFGDLRF